ncbi:unnamed protein product, partial [Meganyctiphanes norvegica]
MEKSPNSGNMISITTSETIRIDGDRSNLHLQAVAPPASQGFQQQQKKKSSSFQITSITSRLSNDGGEDSADDTDDISLMDDSKVTDIDQETPSFSEDYSKSEEVFFGPAPVIPTSSQYGITALVQQTGSGGVMTARLPQGVTVNVTEGGLALAKADGESDDVDDWHNRFKIVKIDSNEPFKRGRWICLDFMDSPAVNASSGQKKDDGSNIVVNNSGHLKEKESDPPQTVVKVTTQVSQTQGIPPQQVQQVTQTQYPSQQTQAQPTLVQHSHGNQGAGIAMQSTQHLPANSQNQSGIQYQTQSSMQGQQINHGQGYSSTTQANQGSVHPSPSTQTAPKVQGQLQQPQLQQQQPPISKQPMHVDGQQQPGVSMPTASQAGGIQQPIVASNSHTQPSQHQQQVKPSISQPIPPQNVSMTQQNIQIPQQSHPTQAGMSGMPVMGNMAGQGVNINQQNVPQQQVPQTVPQPNVAPPVQQNVSQSQGIPQQIPTQITNTQQVSGSQAMPGAQTIPGHSQTSGTSTQPMANSSSSATPQASQGPMPSYPSHPTSVPATTPATTPAQAQPHMNVVPSAGHPAPVTEKQQMSSATLGGTAALQQPPKNLDGLPSSQPKEDSATPPQPEDTDRIL